MSPTESSSRATEDDRSLFAAIARGEPSGLSQLYDRHGAVMFGLCLRIVKDRMAAEETLEDVFWELWRKPDRFDASRGTALAYLMNLTQSRAIDRLRARARRQRLSPSGDSANLQAGAALRLTTDHDDPSYDCLQTEQRDRVRHALGGLSTGQRAAIELAYFEGLTHVEIAAKLSQPLGTVKTRIRQALVHLRESLRAEFGGSESSAAVQAATRTDFQPEGQRNLA